jgi:hypothetical protein
MPSSKQSSRAVGSRRLPALGRLAAIFLLLGSAYLASMGLLDQINAPEVIILAGGFAFALCVFPFVYVIRPHAKEAYKKPQIEKVTNPSLQPIAVH